MSFSSVVEVVIQDLPKSLIDLSYFSRIGIFVPLQKKGIKDLPLFTTVGRDDDLTTLKPYSNLLQSVFMQEYLGKKVQECVLIPLDITNPEGISNNLNLLMKEHLPCFNFATYQMPESVFDLILPFISMKDRILFHQISTIEEAEALSTKIQNQNLGKSIFLLMDSTPESSPAIGALMSLLTPGNQSAKLKTLTGIQAHTYTETQLSTAFSQRYNVYYQETLDYSYITEGILANGEFFDSIFGLAYLKALLAQNLQNTLMTKRNIDLGFNARSYAIIESTIRNTCFEMVKNQFIKEEISVKIPQIQEINPDSFAKRILDSIEITLQLIPKIHSIKVNVIPEYISEV